MKRLRRKGMQLATPIRNTTTARDNGRLARWCENALSARGPGSIISTLVVSAIVVVGTMLYVFAVLPAQAARRWWRGRS